MYELQDGNGNFIERGDVPALIADLPAGQYFALATYHGHALKQGIAVANKETNSVPFHFAFGASRVESVPASASVFAANGDYVGVTPVVLAELPPATTEYHLELKGYQNATVSVTVAENQTNSASATLLNLSYVGSMRQTRQGMEAGNYRSAVFAARDALAAKPGDADALILETNAQCRLLVQEAKDLATNKSDYIAADLKLKEALTLLPDDAEAKQLLAEYQPHEAAEMVKIKAWRTGDLFDRVCKANPDAGLFDAHDVTLPTMTPEAFRDAFVQSCQSKVPTFKVTVNQSAENGIYELSLVQSVDILIVAVRRECLMVIGTDKDGQTLVRFKVLEYTRKGGLVVNVNAINNVTAGNPNQWIPVRPNQGDAGLGAQLQEGVRIVMRKVNEASGQNQHFVRKFSCCVSH